MEGQSLITSGSSNTTHNGAPIRVLQFNAVKRQTNKPSSPSSPSSLSSPTSSIYPSSPYNSYQSTSANSKNRHGYDTYKLPKNGHGHGYNSYKPHTHSHGNDVQFSEKLKLPVCTSASVINNNFQRVQALPNGKKMERGEFRLDLPANYLRYNNSFKVLRNLQDAGSPASPSMPGSPGCSSPVPYLVRPASASNVSRLFNDGNNKSWTSVGMGSTDGRKMIVRRVPTSPNELFNIVNTAPPPEEYLFEDSCDGSDDGNENYMKPRRQQWSNKLQFVLACIGYSVGLGSVWRFPYLCYKSGGGVFLIPYFILLIICGVPMLYMELSVGQFTGRGPIGALGQLCPLFKGTGVASVVISFLMSTYYSVIIAYGIYYFFTSLKPIQPWANCNNRWNTPSCWIPNSSFSANSSIENITRPFESRTPAEEFYDEKVLKVSAGIEYFGSLRWELVACLLCAWAIIYFAIWKSIKSSGKVRYFTATIPFLIIVILMGKSLTLEGAQRGMRYFFRPNWKLLGDSKVWVNAATQTFNSMGIAFGSMISFASYSRYNNNILHDTIAVSCVNALTSLLVGIFAFATIGNISVEQNKSIDDVIADGPGLIFVVFPQAMAKMPVPQLWSSLFFFMLLCLALNSQFAIVEVVVTSIQDGFPVWIKKNLMCHEVLVFVVCIVSFFLGLPNVTNGGIYFFQLIDHYAASISIMYVAFVEIIAIAWFYGVWRLAKNIEHMTGKQPSLYFKFCWTIAAPMMIFAIWVFYMIDYESPTYNNGLYHYPDWAIAIGWVITSFSIFCLPIFMISSFVKAKGKNFTEKMRWTLKPNIPQCDTCGEHNCEHLEKLQEFLEGEAMLDIRNINGITISVPNTPLSMRNGNENINNDSYSSPRSSKDILKQ